MPMEGKGGAGEVLQRERRAIENILGWRTAMEAPLRLSVSMADKEVSHLYEYMCEYPASSSSSPS
ncbi:hypothetical protein NQZ68_022941 [Dissostichus eleginoides]|nr:hypothetical protein NQZ68_022941 [Dissostichus eleginoides]